LARAKQLLAESDMAIAQVANECGYDDLAYFTAFFRNRAGTTPAVYREAVRKSPAEHRDGPRQ
jgi:AraC-like DNA-binding protein